MAKNYFSRSVLAILTATFGLDNLQTFYQSEVWTKRRMDQKAKSEFHTVPKRLRPEIKAISAIFDNFNNFLHFRQFLIFFFYFFMTRSTQARSVHVPDRLRPGSSSSRNEGNLCFFFTIFTISTIWIRTLMGFTM